QDGIDRERAIAAAEPSTVDAPRFEVAKAQLARIDVIGFSEQYDEFIDELRRRFGWWPSGIDTKGKVNLSREAWEASAVLRRVIADDIAFDVKLYEYAKQLGSRRGPPAIATTSPPRERT